MSQAVEAAPWWLLRAAVLQVGDPPQEFQSGLRQNETITRTIRMIRVDGKPVGMLSLAAIPLRVGPIAGESFDMPNAARRQLEEALEMHCRFVALEHRTTHRVISPQPCIGLHCPNISELDALEGTRVNVPSGSMTVVGVGQSGLLGDSRLMELLMDRLDGVVMLTEALNARSPLGEFTQFWRLFERAFHRGFREASPLLVEFLRGGPHGFGDEEIDVWVEKRNPAVHADRRQTPTLDVDVQPIVGRMKEAAYDVLLNKPGWSDTATERREVWKPASGSSDLKGSVFGVKGKAWTLKGQLLDEFGSYPLLLAGPVEDVLPLAAWAIAENADVYLRRRGVGALDLN